MTRQRRATHASATRRPGGGLRGEGIGQALRMKRQRALPGSVERRAREALPQPMRTGARHACIAGGVRDIAGGEQRGEEKPLLVRRPTGAIGGGGRGGRGGRGRMRGGVLVHL